MIEMSPFYAHDSSVGPVFDVATWSRGKAVWMAGACLIGGIVFATAAVYALSPGLFFEKPPEWLGEFNENLREWKADYPWATYAGIGVAALFGLGALAGAFTSIADCIESDYYFRAGPGGISFRVPNGLDFSRFCLATRVLELDLSHDEIADWTIVQHKQLGALSRDAGNISAHLKIRTVAGKKHEFLLDCFREPARIIDQKIKDAMQMVPANFGPDDAPPPEVPSRTATTVGGRQRFEAISTALGDLLGGTDPDAAVIVSDPATNKFVQFASVENQLLFDLPSQTLDETEMLRATEFFDRLGSEIQQYHLLDAPGGIGVATQRSFQLNLAHDVQQAATLVAAVFEAVYRVPADAALVVERM